jgi:hypothetical protein
LRRTIQARLYTVGEEENPERSPPLVRTETNGGAGGLSFDTPTTYKPITQYWDPNSTKSEMDAAWDAIDTSPMAVALHDEYVKKVGLPPSGRFPWDTERSIYYLKGLHDLHCIVCIRLCKCSL